MADHRSTDTAEFRLIASAAAAAAAAHDTARFFFELIVIVVEITCGELNKHVVDL